MLENIVKNAVRVNEVVDETTVTNRNVFDEIPMHAFRVIKRRAIAIKRYYIFGGIP